MMDSPADEARSIRLIREEMRFEVAALEGRVNALISAEAFLTIAFTMALGNANAGPVAPLLSLIGLILAILAWPGVSTGVRIINEWNTLLIAALAEAPEATLRVWRPSAFSEGARRSDRAHRRGMLFARAVPIVFSVAWVVLAVIALRKS